ncbi:MAG: thiol peroxidase [Myxococcota bacterium]
MTTITLKGNPIETRGSLPALGTTAPPLRLCGPDLVDVTLDAYAGHKKVLNIFPSLDTGVCAMSVRRFNTEAAAHPDVFVLNVSADLPFAHRRFCAAEGIDKAKSLSTFRSTFAADYGLDLVTGPMTGLCSRCVLVLDADNRVIYQQQVPEIGQEPDYAAAIAALG